MTDARDFLRLGFYQLFLLDTQSMRPFMKLSNWRRKRIAALVNAVLRTAHAQKR